MYTGCVDGAIGQTKEGKDIIKISFVWASIMAWFVRLVRVAYNSFLNYSQ